jgi:hypothetical protein
MEAVDQVHLNFNPATLAVLNGPVGLIMFGVAPDIRVDDFKRVVRDPRGPLLGLAAQFLLLPAMTFLLVLIIKPLPSRSTMPWVWRSAIGRVGASVATATTPARFRGEVTRGTVPCFEGLFLLG